MPDNDWLLDANCKGASTRVFFIYREDKTNDSEEKPLTPFVERAK